MTTDLLEMKVWIDLSNSPHPLLFTPIRVAFEEEGHMVFMTARDNAQTLELARQRWPDVRSIGTESPHGRTAKARALGSRAYHLYRWAKVVQPDVALSHNSYAQIVASRVAGIPVVTAMDYEHQPANHLAFRLADRVILPKSFPDSFARRQGACSHKVIRYTGLKEEIYVADFEPDRQALSVTGIDNAEQRMLVIARAPPSGALYHRFENDLFSDVLQILGRRQDLWCVVLARRSEQRNAIRALELPALLVPHHAVDARSLMYFSDLVLGAGGTMTREAAVLGIPTATVYQGRRGAVELELERQGRLCRIATPAEIDALITTPRLPISLDQLRRRGARLTEVFLETVLGLARHSS
jgi:predicted glycosyltransferase